MLPDFFKPYIKTFFLQLKQKNPGALDFGVDFVELILKLRKEGIDPPFAIAYTMLDRDFSNDTFESRILERHLRDPNYLFNDNAYIRNSGQELQGYVDITMMVIAMFVDTNKAIDIVRKLRRDDEKDVQNAVYSLLRRVEQVPQVRSMPDSSEKMALQFILDNLPYALEEFEESEPNVVRLLERITARAKRENYSDTFYYRGACAAQDTFLLYHELISRTINHPMLGL